MNIEDNTIARYVREKPETGFRLLMQKYKQPVYWHIRRLVVAHADAQDATQETFIRIFRSFDQCRNTSALRSWIFRIANNEAFRLIGSRKQQSVSLEENESGANHIASDGYTDYSDLEAVRLQRAIQTLPSKQRSAFCLRYYDELSYEEIADAIESTPSAVKASYHIAKERIIKYMNAND